MHSPLFIAIFVVSAALLACAPARPKPLAQPEAIVPQGDFVHAPSGMRFPQQLGEFERRAVQRNDTHGLDMSSRYDLLSMSVSIEADVKVSPMQHLDVSELPAEMAATARENLSQQTFEVRKREVMSALPGSVLSQEGDASLPLTGKPIPGKFAAFEHEGLFLKQQQRLRTQLYLFCFTGGEWAVQYRFTFPRDSDALSEIEQFLTALPWTLEGPAPSSK